MLVEKTHRAKKGDQLVIEKEIEWTVPDSFTRSLIAKRRSELQAFANALRNESVRQTVIGEQGDEAFDDLIRLAVNDYGVGQRQIAEAVQINVATVSRWVAGTSRAPRLSRPTILSAIATLIEHDIEVES